MHDKIFDAILDENPAALKEAMFAVLYTKLRESIETEKLTNANQLFNLLSDEEEVVEEDNDQLEEDLGEEEVEEGMKRDAAYGAAAGAIMSANPLIGAPAGAAIGVVAGAAERDIKRALAKRKKKAAAKRLEKAKRLVKKEEVDVDNNDGDIEEGPIDWYQGKKASRAARYMAKHRARKRRQAKDKD